MEIQMGGFQTQSRSGGMKPKGSDADGNGKPEINDKPRLEGVRGRILKMHHAAACGPSALREVGFERHQIHAVLHDLPDLLLSVRPVLRSA